MTFLPFDTYSYINPSKLEELIKNTTKNPNKFYNKEGYMYVLKLVDGTLKLKHPFLICEHFNVPYTLKDDGEFIWEKVELIREQVSFELGNLMTREGRYILDWHSDGSFGVFFKKN